MGSTGKYKYSTRAMRQDFGGRGEPLVVSSSIVYLLTILNRYVFFLVYLELYTQDP